MKSNVREAIKWIRKPVQGVLYRRFHWKDGNLKRTALSFASRSVLSFISIPIALLLVLCDHNCFCAPLQVLPRNSNNRSSHSSYNFNNMNNRKLSCKRLLHLIYELQSNERLIYGVAPLCLQRLRLVSNNPTRKSNRNWYQGQCQHKSAMHMLDNSPWK